MKCDYARSHGHKSWCYANCFILDQLHKHGGWKEEVHFVFLSLFVKSRYNTDPHSSSRTWATPMWQFWWHPSVRPTPEFLCVKLRDLPWRWCFREASLRPPSDPPPLLATVLLPDWSCWGFHISGSRLFIGSLAQTPLQAVVPPPLTPRNKGQRKKNGKFFAQGQPQSLAALLLPWGL